MESWAGPGNEAKYSGCGGIHSSDSDQIGEASGYTSDKNQHNNYRNNSVPVNVGALIIDIRTFVL